MALNSIASQQSKPTQLTLHQVIHFLDYITTHPSAIIRYYASNMKLNIHSDESYLSEPKGRSRVAGHYFLGSIPKNNIPIPLNGAIHNLCSILKHVAASAAESELGGVFTNARMGKIMRLTLLEMGHPQPATPIHTDNTTAAGIANNTVKRQRSRAMDMRYFWITDQVEQKQFLVQWHPGTENLADYISKHHSAKIHRHVRPYYVHMPNSPRNLNRSMAPSALRGCVGTPSRVPLSGHISSPTNAMSHLIHEGYVTAHI